MFTERVLSHPFFPFTSEQMNVYKWRRCRFTSEPRAALMEEIFPPVLHMVRGVIVSVGDSKMLDIDIIVVSRLCGEGDMVAGRLRKSREKPSAIKNCVGSSRHFLKFIINPALISVSMIISRVMKALS